MEPTEGGHSDDDHPFTVESGLAHSAPQWFLIPPKSKATSPMKSGLSKTGFPEQTQLVFLDLDSSLNSFTTPDTRASFLARDQHLTWASRFRASEKDSKGSE
jgi:hypothetical protein